MNICVSRKTFLTIEFGIQLNMQAAFLISTKSYTEKQIGVLFLAFSLSQFIFMAPAGYYLDYSNHKIKWVIWAGFAISALTVLTTISAEPSGENMPLMVILKIIQGAITAILPPGFNAITLGIVGSTGFTHQVSRNKMMNHIGTALFVATGSLMAYFLYPNIGVLFVVSPLATIGVYYNLIQIKPTHVDRDAARCLIIESPTMTEYEQLDSMVCEDRNSYEVGSDDEFDSSQHLDQDSNVVKSYTPPDTTATAENPISAGLPSNKFPNKDLGDKTPATVNSKTSSEMSPQHKHFKRDHSNASSTNAGSYGSDPSYNFGWGRRDSSEASGTDILKARTPKAVLMDPTLITFTVAIFFFHLANSSVLPLVMQSLALQDAQSGILLSGLCILIGQTFSAYFSKVCGDYSPQWGRKGLTLVGLASLTIRCCLLTILLSAQEEAETQSQRSAIKALIMSTQLFAAVGTGILGTLQILVTNDISCRTGRFSLMLGVTTGAMCLGATVSGYIGQTIAQDYGYTAAFAALGAISLIPLFVYTVFMPETLPDFAKPIERRRRILLLLRKFNEQRRKLAMKANPFRRRTEKLKADVWEETAPPNSTTNVETLQPDLA